MKAHFNLPLSEVSNDTGHQDVGSVSGPVVLFDPLLRCHSFERFSRWNEKLVRLLEHLCFHLSQ